MTPRSSLTSHTPLTPPIDAAFLSDAAYLPDAGYLRHIPRVRPRSPLTLRDYILASKWPLRPGAVSRVRSWRQRQAQNVVLYSFEIPRAPPDVILTVFTVPPINCLLDSWVVGYFR